MIKQKDVQTNVWMVHLNVWNSQCNRFRGASLRFGYIKECKNVVKE